MKFYKNLYLGESVKKKKAKIIWKLKSHAGLLNIYVFMIPKGGTEVEYLNSSYLKQKYYRRNKPVIVGIAEGLEEAEAVLQQMVLDAFAETGSYDVNAFLRSLIHQH